MVARDSELKHTQMSNSTQTKSGSAKNIKVSFTAERKHSLSALIHVVGGPSIGGSLMFAKAFYRLFGYMPPPGKRFQLTIQVQEEPS